MDHHPQGTNIPFGTPSLQQATWTFVMVHACVSYHGCARGPFEFTTLIHLGTFCGLHSVPQPALGGSLMHALICIHMNLHLDAFIRKLILIHILEYV